jgi:serine/threonine protein kinase/tetratricopeptide (TPR) repeat protein
MIPAVGDRLGPYEILGKLGGGGMGLVFRAWDERLHREVAIKLLYDEYKMPQMRERFLLEARAASGLNHPNICTVFDIGEQDGNPYLVMELLEGETLKERIARGAVPVGEIIRYGQEIAAGLAVAHDKGIVHRDVKPANIFLVTMPNGRSQAKVLDFGLAKIELEARGGWQSRMLDMTLAGATVGTLAYMSPEQARGELLDGRTDLFSLGVVMYEMATRQIPFRGTTSALVFVELFTRSPESVRLWNESIPRELEQVILKLLSKDCKGRFQTAKELDDSLGKIAEKLDKGGWLSRGTAAAAVPLVHVPDPVARHKRQRPRTVETLYDSGEKIVTPAAPISSAENQMNRPARMMEGDLGEAVLQPEVQSVSAQSDSSAIAADARAAKRAADDLAAKQASRREFVSAGPNSGQTPFESGWDNPELQPLLAEKPIQHRGLAAIAGLAWFSRRNVRVVATTVLVAAVATGIFLLVRNGLFRPMVLGKKDRLLLTVIQNKTGNQTLDGTVMQGLEIALRQSTSMNVLGGEAYRAGLRQIEADGGEMASAPGQRVAEKVGAKAYVYGEIRGSTPYAISIEVLQADTNDKMASLEETAQDREQIPAAIGRLAQAVRAEMTSSGMRRVVRLEQGTTNVDALHAYAVGEAAMQSGQTGAALEAYRRAVTLDPKFVQAQMRLAWLYHAEKVEVASANAAELAQIGAVHVDEKLKLLAQFCYEMNASGDYGQAEQTIRRYVSKYPLDVDGMKGMARVLRLQGDLPEALLAAQQGYRQHPFDAETYAEAELALIGMDRYEAALQLQAQARRIGIIYDKNVSAAGYLEEKNVAVMAARDVVQLSYEELNTRGLYLDGTGRMSEGLVVWRTAVAKASQVPELASAQAYMLAQGALDRALAEDCTTALEMVSEVESLPRGPVASFNAGMAAALCGDQTYAQKMLGSLPQSFPRNTAVKNFYVPELETAAYIGVNEPAKALKIAMGTRAHEQISLMPYLRGLAHAATGQMPLAISDFQSVLAHKGLAFSMGGNLYPMAEIEVARAYGTDGNKADSVVAYRRFLVSWSEADRGQPRLTEAVAKSK